MDPLSTSKNLIISRLSDFVKAHGGNKVIRRILIANNGNAAVKCIRSLRHWSYQSLGSSRALEFVVLATAEDIEANAEFVSEADVYVEVPSGPSTNNYANVQLIAQVAEAYACDAVWPGWGHASENPALPAALSKLSPPIEWIGPPVDAMRALGGKIESSIIAQSVDVPCVPWSGNHVNIDIEEFKQSGIPEDLLFSACVNSVADVETVLGTIGYPSMIKASDGGGGKGIRKVTQIEDVESAYRQVINEVRGSPVFVMKMVQNCRHLEVQLLADKYGECVAVGSRDCSVQRRCQKIVEEGPIIAASKSVVKSMEEAACRMAKAVGYENAGTAEFLYDPKTKEFFFLEVNARLQVEHVVTECVGGLNLPAAQLLISMGIPISNIKDVTSYLEKYQIPDAIFPHVIAARITAEHAEENFRPTVGAVHELTFRPSRFAWGYFSIGSRGSIHAYNDAQFGHIFASGKNREEAREHLVLALKDLTIRGDVRTNIEALIKILEEPSYKENRLHTTWLEECVKFEGQSDGVSSVRTLLFASLASAFEAYMHFKSSEDNFIKRVEQGQLPPAIQVNYSSTLVLKQQKFCFECLYSGPSTITLETNSTYAEVLIRRIAPSTENGTDLKDCAGGAFIMRCSIDGRSRRAEFKSDSTGIRISCEGTTYTFSRESDPTQVRAPVSGKLVRWLVANEAVVSKGQPFAEIEIMKMYMQLHLEESGTIHLNMAEGAVFNTGDLMASLELPVGVEVCKAEPYLGGFPVQTSVNEEFNESTYLKRHPTLNQIDVGDDISSMCPLQLYRSSRSHIEALLDGYQLRPATPSAAIKAYFNSVTNPMLAVVRIKEVLAALEPQLPQTLLNEINEMLNTTALNIKAKLFPQSPREESSDEKPKNGSIILQNEEEGSNLEVPATECLEAIERYLTLQNSADCSGPCGLRTILLPLFDILNAYTKGLIFAGAEDLADLLERYLDVEELFESSHESAAKVISLKRTELSTTELARLQRSYQALQQRMKLIADVLDNLRRCPVWQSSYFINQHLRSYAHFTKSLPRLHSAFQRLSCLGSCTAVYARVCLSARELMLTKRRKSLGERIEILKSKLVQYIIPNTVVLSPLRNSFSSTPTSTTTASTLHTLSTHTIVSQGEDIINNMNLSTQYQYHQNASPKWWNNNLKCNNTTSIPFGGQSPIQNGNNTNPKQILHNACNAAGTNNTGSMAWGVYGASSPRTGTWSAPTYAVRGSTPLNPNTPNHYATQYQIHPNASANIERLVHDAQNCSDAALLHLVSDEYLPISKLAMQIFIRRYFGRRGLHQMILKSHGDLWMPRLEVKGNEALNLDSSSMHEFDEDMSAYRKVLENSKDMSCNALHENIACISTSQHVQQQIPILAVWTHHALFTLDILNASVDLLKATNNTNPMSFGCELCDQSKIIASDKKALQQASENAERVILSDSSLKHTDCTTDIALAAINMPRYIETPSMENSASNTTVESHANNMPPFIPDQSAPTLDPNLVLENSSLKDDEIYPWCASASSSMNTYGCGSAYSIRDTIMQNSSSLDEFMKDSYRCSNKLQHVLSHFSGGYEAGYEDWYPIGSKDLRRSQRSVGLLFKSLENTATQLAVQLNEYKNLNFKCCIKSHMKSSLKQDSFLLWIFLSESSMKTASRAYSDSTAPKESNRTSPSGSDSETAGKDADVKNEEFDKKEDMEHKSSSEEETKSEKVLYENNNESMKSDTLSKASFHNWQSQEEAGRATLLAALNENADLLHELGFNLVVFVRVPSDSKKVCGAGFPLQLVDVSVPRISYYRNIRQIPVQPVSAAQWSDMYRQPDSNNPQGSENSDSSRGGTQTPPTEPACEHAISKNYFVEEELFREASISSLALLELSRMRNFYVSRIPTSVPNVYLFHAIPKSTPSKEVKKSSNGDRSRDISGARYFVRIIVPQLTAYERGSDEYIFSEQERYFICGLNALEAATKTGHNSDIMCGNHMLISIQLLHAPWTHSEGSPQDPIAEHCPNHIPPASFDEAARRLLQQYERRVTKLNIRCIEFRYTQRTLHGEASVPVRIVLDNPTGQALRIRKYLEVVNPTTSVPVFTAIDCRDSNLMNHNSSFYSSQGMKHRMIKPSNRISNASEHDYSHCNVSTLQPEDSSFDGKPLDIPHPLASFLDAHRAQAARVSTVYIYDFLDLIEEALRKKWYQCPKYFLPVVADEKRHSFSDSHTAAHSLLPDKVLEAVELRLNSCGRLEKVERGPGLNECGMVAWRLKLFTPEFPKGRRAILIGNDVTYQMGTFGVQEDLLFQRASEIARFEGIPRIYISVNSGARMGLASEVQRSFRVEWNDANDPCKGFKYIYVTAKDYAKLAATDSIVAEPVEHPTEGTVYRITDVIGAQIGLGVENLCGSGAIAGETSRAYRDTFTVTYATGRSVGIGAYITRLGQRVIQKAVDAPLLLTGYQALNRLIGRDVYSSNAELGGVDIMHRNGITHLVVKTDLEGCEQILDWLSYVPEHREGPLPIMVDPTDPLNRPVLYKPARATEDPRLMFTGCTDPCGRWLSGIFDKGSFKEVLSDWAKSVVCGRARLGGIPCGVVAVETRVTESVQPADPAMPHTSEITLTRAGQVWFPDSAYKTAQAIWDFDKEELPLFIFANWKGFSGGQRDMFNEVLKFGSYIVDALVSYRQPCFVYIPPKGELRGGSWVVVDSRLNPEHMEIYADTESRAGVMEPSGTVEIKYRAKALRETATRLDPILQALDQEDAQRAAQGEAIDGPCRQDIKERRERRLHQLMPVYKQVALHFADMHDTAVRMKRRHAVRDIVPWGRSRVYFYWRLRRQLIVHNIRNEIRRADSSISLGHAEHLLMHWARQSGQNVESNYQFVQWACHSSHEIEARLQQIRTQRQKKDLKGIIKEQPHALFEVLRDMYPVLYARMEASGPLPSPLRSSSERALAALSAITNPTD